MLLRKWSGLELLLEANGGTIALDILRSMQKRGKELFSTSVMLAAIYLDAKNRDAWTEGRMSAE